MQSRCKLQLCSCIRIQCHLIVSAQAGAANTLATAFLDPVQVSAGALGVAAPGNGDDDVIVDDDRVNIGQNASGRWNSRVLQENVNFLA